jgi:hypothetical protein
LGWFRCGFRDSGIDLGGALPTWNATFALPSVWQSIVSPVVVPPLLGAASTLIELDPGRGGPFIGPVTLSPGQAIASAASGSVGSEVAAGPPGRFFAYNGDSSGFEFYTIDTSSGSFVAKAHALLLSGYSQELSYDPEWVRLLELWRGARRPRSRRAASRSWLLFASTGTTRRKPGGMSSLPCARCCARLSEDAVCRRNVYFSPPPAALAQLDQYELSTGSRVAWERWLDAPKGPLKLCEHAEARVLDLHAELEPLMGAVRLKLEKIESTWVPVARDLASWLSVVRCATSAQWRRNESHARSSA